MTDLQVVLNALSKERNELHEQLMQIDRIIKRMKEGNLGDEQGELIPVELQPVKLAAQRVVGLGGSQDRAKVIVLKAFDIIRHACKLREVQDEYNKITGKRYNIRESVRALQRQGLLMLVREKGSDRGYYWIKSEWLKDEILSPEYKPEGFDLLYQPDNIIFE
jgi:hypothetical protein